MADVERAGTKPANSIMFTVLHQIGELQKSIRIFVSKNRHESLVEEFKILEDCLTKLERLKRSIVKANEFREKHCCCLMKIVRLLDALFGLGSNILDFFNGLD